MTIQNKIFGTDGIRSQVGIFPMTVELIMKLGWSVGKTLPAGSNVLIGKDTRVSGYMVESALEAGLSAAGASIHLLGPMPTSGIAYLTRTLRAQMGIMISASHNAFSDNGIKFFSAEGYKISSEFEQTIEDLLNQPITTGSSKVLGRKYRVKDAVGRYIEFCKSSLPHNTVLKNLKIVVDCANGATYHVAPAVFSELGAEVVVINAAPNGFNINLACGSNHPEMLQKHVIAEKADLGIAFDGDGDRVIMVDSKGEVLDGDELLYILCKGLLASEKFHGGVVGTVMSNRGLECALNDLGIHFVRVPVGYHHIIEALIQKKWVLGGESSGHTIYMPVSTTADGIITALQVLHAMQTCQMGLHEIKQGIKKFPQLLIKIPNDGSLSFEHEEIVREVKEAQEKLGKTGRVLLRHSGTEPVIKIMVEGEDNILVKSIAKRLEKTIKKLIPTFPTHTPI